MLQGKFHWKCGCSFTTAFKILPLGICSLLWLSRDPLQSVYLWWCKNLIVSYVLEEVGTGKELCSSSLIKFVLKMRFCNFLFVVLFWGQIVESYLNRRPLINKFLPWSAFHNWDLRVVSALIKCSQHLHKMARHDSEYIEDGISKIPLCSCSPLAEVDNCCSQWPELEQMEVKTGRGFFYKCCSKWNIALMRCAGDGQGWKPRSRICSCSENSRSGHQRTEAKGSDLLKSVRGKSGDCFTKPALLLFPSGFLSGEVFNFHQFFSHLKYWCVYRGLCIGFPRPKLLVLMYNDAVEWWVAIILSCKIPKPGFIQNASVAGNLGIFQLCLQYRRICCAMAPSYGYHYGQNTNIALILYSLQYRAS